MLTVSTLTSEHNSDPLRTDFDLFKYFFDFLDNDVGRCCESGVILEISRAVYRQF